jgi:hypothetical protein
VKIVTGDGDFTVKMREPTIEGHARILLSAVSSDSAERVGSLSASSLRPAVEEIVTGWEGVIGDSDKPIPYTPAALLTIAAANPETVLSRLLVGLHNALNGFPETHAGDHGTPAAPAAENPLGN